MIHYKRALTLSLSTLVLASAVTLPSTASAASYKPCAAIAKELGAKIARLNRLAAERRAQGDMYGERRLKSLANIVGAHRGNLPCVGKQTCSL